MPNLLSQREKKNIQREYRMRVFATILSLLFIAIVFSIGELLPSYFFITTERTILENELETLQATAEERGDAEATAALAETALVVNAVEAEIAGGVFKTAVLREVLAARPAGVRISGLSFEGEGEESVLVVSGEAATRSGLIDYSEAIETNPRFTEATVPVESLAQTEDISFSMTLTGEF